jgi:hypothetical protein
MKIGEKVYKDTVQSPVSPQRPPPRFFGAPGYAILKLRKDREDKLLAGQLWVRLVKKTRIVRDSVVDCPTGDWRPALAAACRELDLSLPITLPNHVRDWESHGRTRFLAEHFMEHVPFDRMEIEYFDPDDRDTRRRSDDPRNG